MNFKALRYFVAIADAGSFSAAASAIHVAQPALTRRIRELEEELGVLLLSRSHRGVQLTFHGAALYESAQKMLAEENRIIRSLRGSTDGTPSIALGISPTFVRLLLPPVFERCLHQIHGISLRVKEALSPVLLELLELGSIDVAVVTNPTRTRMTSMHLLFMEPYALVSNAKLKLPKIIPAAQLLELPLLMTPIHRGIVNEVLAPLGRELSIAAQIDSVSGIIQLVTEGEWATLMPISVYKSEIARQLRVSEVSGVQLQRSVMLAMRADRLADPAIQAVESVIRAETDRLNQEGYFSLLPVTRSKSSSRVDSWK